MKRPVRTSRAQCKRPGVTCLLCAILLSTFIWFVKPVASYEFASYTEFDSVSFVQGNSEVAPGGRYTRRQDSPENGHGNARGRRAVPSSSSAYWTLSDPAPVPVSNARPSAAPMTITQQPSSSGQQRAPQEPVMTAIRTDVLTALSVRAPWRHEDGQYTKKVYSGQIVKGHFVC